MHREKKDQIRDHRLNYRGKEYNGTSNKSINELIGKFPNTYQFCNGNLNKFVLLLRKGVYPYEYMDSWERFNEKSLPLKKDFYSELTLEDISDKDQNHAQKVFEEYCKVMGDYSASGLAWQACLKKTDVKLELLTDYQMLLMIEEGIRGGMCQSTHRYAKANNKYMKRKL